MKTTYYLSIERLVFFYAAYFSADFFEINKISSCGNGNVCISLTIG